MDVCILLFTEHRVHMIKQLYSTIEGVKFYGFNLALFDIRDKKQEEDETHNLNFITFIIYV